MAGCRVRQEWYDIVKNLGMLLADGKVDQKKKVSERDLAFKT